ncbi:hypothetical protein [Solirubrobacter ginsenosidimutans]|uniref:hypothetical protein n=1 Tax=Solirubrobacter ginsenosidimutans TaxID=490573 RepID=UPI0022CDBEA4|nr:hypothetical protein [Solirubrobacter ginsenosidimutans]
MSEDVPKDKQPWDGYESQSADEIIDRLVDLRNEARTLLDKIDEVKTYEDEHTQRDEIMGRADDLKESIDKWTSKWTSKWAAKN